MPRPKKKPICYPLPHDDPRKDIEQLFEPYFQESYVLHNTDPHVTKIIEPDKAGAFLRRIYRYKKDWHNEADTNPYLTLFSNVLRGLKIIYHTTSKTLEIIRTE